MIVNADKTESMLLRTRQKLQRAIDSELLCMVATSLLIAKPVQVHTFIGLYMEPRTHTHTVQPFVFIQSDETSNVTTCTETML